MMKKLIPRNTTIPVRRSDVFSTAEDNQSQVEIHVLQGERELAEHNKSLGRFKLTGIPPQRRGDPKIQVSFDVDANGILQVTALDTYTGREQSITIQGAANLSDAEIRQMMTDAEEYADADRMRRERIEKRNRTQDLLTQSERILREAAQEFGFQFANSLRRRIEALMRDLKESVKQGDERQMDLKFAALQEALYDFKQEMYQTLREYEEEDELFKMPNLSETFSKGIGAVKEQISGLTGDREGERRRRTRGQEPLWQDWDEDDDW
jgi:molecular chaperone DnaK